MTMTRCTVKHLTLNPLDHFPPSNYTYFVTCLPLKEGVTSEEASQVLREGLRRTFVQLPWLSGKIHYQSPNAPGWRPGQLEIRYDEADFGGDAPLRQLRIKHLDPEELGATYEELRESGFPLDRFDDEQLTPSELLPRYEDGPDCFSAQANFLPGACLLTTASQHAACDGTSQFDVWKIFAANCDSLQEPGSPWPEPPAAESSDRTLLERIWETEGTGTPLQDVDPASWSLLDISRPGEPRLEAAPSLKILSEEPMQAAKFYMSPDKFSLLQKQCAEQTAGQQGVNISANDALSALVWRCMLRAKYKAVLEGSRSSAKQDARSAKARLFMTLDARPDISQAMPMVYLANCFVINICVKPVAALSSAETSVGEVARDIRGVLNKTTRAVLLDGYTVAREAPDLDAIRLNRGHTPGSFDMVLSSLLMFPVQDVKFGGRVFANEGRPDGMQPLMRRFNRASQVCFVMPRRPWGGVELVLNLYPDEMKILLDDDEFSEWCLFWSF
ncbi:hypothetical protein F5Y08DRAFT_18028 [Xylaria arbuscula]|nr:hypothetical protein F5Y08DRAFT_18028 [Xylaria arbuscula]